MKKLVLISTTIFFSLFLTSTAYGCLGHVYGTSFARQVGATVEGYSKTRLDSCAAFYYDSATAGTFTEHYNGGTALLGSGYSQSSGMNPAVVNYSFAQPINGLTYTTISDHYYIAYYQVYMEDWGGGYYWYDPYELIAGFNGNGGGSGEGSDYFTGPGGGYYWVIAPQYVGSTAYSTTYHGVNGGASGCSNGQQFTSTGVPCNYEPPPFPPFDPVSGCSLGYTSLGGIITSEPTASALFSKAVVFARGTDNALYYQYSTGPIFSGWIWLGGATYSAPMSTVINNVLYLEVIGTDNNHYYKSSANGVNFTDWMAGTVNAQTTSNVDLNGLTYDFGQGEVVSQPHLCLEISPTVPIIKIRTPNKPGVVIQNKTQRAMLGATIPLEGIIAGVTAGGVYEWKLDGNVVGSNSKTLNQAITTLGNHTISVRYTKGSVTTPLASVTINVDTPKPPAQSFGEMLTGDQEVPGIGGCNFGQADCLSLGEFDIPFGQGIQITAFVNEYRDEIAKEIISNRNESRLKIVQIVNTENKRINVTTEECKILTRRNTPNPWMLDSSDPYNVGGMFSGVGTLSLRPPQLNAINANIYTVDSPSLTLFDGFNWSLDDKLESYLVYFTGTNEQPQNEKALAVLEWSWGGSTQYNVAENRHDEVPNTLFPTQEMEIQGRVLTPTNQGTGIRDYDRTPVQSFAIAANFQPCQ